MKKIYKMLGLFLLISLSFFLFSCNNNTNTDDNKSNNNTNDKEPEAKQYTINYLNELNDVSLSVSVVKTTDYGPEKTNVISGNKYDENVKIYIKVTNNSNVKLALNVKINSAIIKREFIDASTGDAVIKEINTDLTGDANINVIDASTINTGLLIINQDTSANNKEVQNVCHAYNPDDPDKADYVNGQEIEYGMKVKIFEFNYATRVHFVLYHNGELIADKDYDLITDETWFIGHEEFFEFVVEGDILITVTNI